MDDFRLENQGLVSDTIQIKLGEDPFNISEKRAYRANKDFMIKIEDERAKVGNVKFTVLPSTNDELKLEVSRESNGSTFESAKDKAENIDYGFTNDSNSLYFNLFFSFPSQDLLRDQEVRVKLLLPVGKTVYLDRSALRVIYDIPSVTDTYDTYMVDHYWTMEDRGLVCTDCAVKDETTLSIEANDTSISVKVEVNY